MQTLNPLDFLLKGIFAAYSTSRPLLNSSILFRSLKSVIMSVKYSLIL